MSGLHSIVGFHMGMSEAGVEHLMSCTAWAFGDDWHDLQTNMAGDRFRTRHPEIPIEEQSMILTE